MKFPQTESARSQSIYVQIDNVLSRSGMTIILSDQMLNGNDLMLANAE
jgi:hypothetical protein